MLSGSYVNPRTCILPFEMFRSFGPALDEDWPSVAGGVPEGLNRAVTEVISSQETPQLELNGAELRHLEFQLGLAKIPAKQLAEA